MADDKNIFDPSDDLTNDYLMTRQIAQEFNSPAVQAFLRYEAESEKEMEFHQGLAKPKTPEKEETDTGFEEAKKKHIAQVGEGEEEPGLEDPWIDPVMAGAGGFGGVAKMSLSTGAKLMPTLVRATTAAVSGAAADVPIGAATELVEDKHPKLALPFNVITGLVSGATIENAVEKGVMKYFSGKGVKASTQLVSESVSKIKGDLAAGTNLQDDATIEAIKAINGDVDIANAAKAGGIEVPTEKFKPTRPDEPEITKVGYEGQKIEESTEALADEAEVSKPVFKKTDSSTYVAKRNKSSKPEFLTPYKPSEMTGWKNYLSEDGVGYSITDKNDIVGVFNNSGKRGAGQEAVVQAIKNGGKTLDCIDGHLDKYYNKFGFKLKERIPWDDQYAPEGWNYEKYGRPAVSFWEYPEELSRNPIDIRRRFKAAQRREDELSGYPGAEKLRGGEHGGDIEAAQPRVGQGKSGQADRGTGVDRLNVEDSPPEDLVISVKNIEAKAEAFLKADMTDISDKAININFNRIDSVDRLKEAIAKTADIFEPDIQKARRGVVSNAETARLADLVGISPETLIKRKSGQAFNAHEAVAARKVLVASAERLSILAKRITSKEADDLDKFAFQKQLSIHQAIQAEVSGMTAEAGRALQAFNIPVAVKPKAVKDLDELDGVIKMMTEKMDDDGIMRMHSKIVAIKEAVC